MNEYSILLLNKTYRQEAIQQAEALRLARRAKAAGKQAQPRRVNANLISVVTRWWLWTRRIRFGSTWVRPLALKNEVGC